MELLHEKEFAPESIEGKVVAVIKTCYDPEIPVDIFSMGLIYEVEVSDTKDVQVTMTLEPHGLARDLQPAARRASAGHPCLAAEERVGAVAAPVPVGVARRREELQVRLLPRGTAGSGWLYISNGAE